MRITDIRMIETDQSHIHSSPAAHTIRRAHTTNAPQHKDVAYAYTHARRAFQTTTIPDVVRYLRQQPPQNVSIKAATKSISSIRLPDALVTTEPSVFTPRKDRKVQYNQVLLQAFRPTPDYDGNGLWATDGSSKNLSYGHVSFTAAVVGKTSATFRLTGQMSSSMHVERLGLIAALLETQRHGPEQLIVTDHLNSVRDVARMRHPDYRSDTWRPRPGHELYHWLARAISHTTDDQKVQHIKAHTGEEDARSKQNELADNHARLAHHSNSTTMLPPITGWMRPYVIYVPWVGYCPDNWQVHYTDGIARHLWQRQSTKQRGRLQISNGLDPPDYFYHKSPSGVTAKFQLIMRTGTFMTNAILAKTTSVSPECGFCSEVETQQHVFQHCAEYEAFRKEAIKKALQFWRTATTPEWRSNDTIRTSLESHLDAVIRRRSTVHRYWMGQTPPPPALFGSLEHKISHNMAITLTSRIAGHRLRKGERKTKEDGEEDHQEDCAIQ